ncbi:MAG: SRPBCC domain-containing protein [Pseudomonadota bacterium]
MSTEIQFRGNDLIVRRTYAASIEDVFDAWIETSKIRRWWGCAECTDVQSEVEASVGGKYNHHMTLETDTGSHEVPGFATLVEFDPPHKLAYTSNDEQDPMIITVSFAEVAGGTRVELVHSNIPSMKVDGDQELRDVIRRGWSAATDKLASVVEVATTA